MKDNWKYYKKKLSFLLFILAIILSVHGLFVYYQPRIDRPWQLISAVLYGTIKMFLFVAPLSAEADTALTYEIAKWLAPFLTSALVLTKLTNSLFHFKNSLINRASKQHVILFEKTQAGDALIQNLLKSKENYKISLITKEPILDEWRNQYEKMGVAVYLFHFEHALQREIDEMIGLLNINHSHALIFHSENDLENYALFAKLLSHLKPKKEIKCFLRCESNSMPLYLEEIIAKEKDKNSSIGMLDIMTFNEEELAVRMLVEQIQQSEGLLHLNFKKLRTHPLESETLENLTVEKIESSLEPAHFLIFGVNPLISPLLKHLANDATLSINKKTKVHIIDIRAQEKMQDFLLQNEEIQQALEIEISSVNPKYRTFSDFLRNLRKTSKISAIFLISEDTIENLEMIKTIEPYFSNVPKAIRNVSGVSLEPILSAHKGKINVFGDIHHIMTPEILIRSELDVLAKKFNQSYNQCMSYAGLGSGSAWQELSSTKKDSSRASASHSRIKREILSALMPQKSEEQIKSLLCKWFDEFQEIEGIHKENPNSYQERLTEFLNNNPILDFLARLEHRRWCNSYYAMNFKYGDVKDEHAKTHPCLVDEWEKIMTTHFHSCHPEYDLIATFALFPKEDNDESRNKTPYYYG